MKIRFAAAALLATALVVGCGHGGKTTHIDGMTPSPVMAGFNREFPGLTLSHTDQIVLPNGTTEYELKFRDASSGYRHKMFSPDGTLLGDKSGVVMAPMTQPAK